MHKVHIKKYELINQEELKKESLFSKEDAYLVVNENDPDLIPIKIPLPEPPKKYYLIDGWELPKAQQKFKRLVQPQQLTELMKKHTIVSSIWAALALEKHKYKESIDFIKRMWYHRLNGYWFMCNGVPTFIDGWHFFYLNNFYLDVGYPKYLDRDRKFFLFARFCYNDTKTFSSVRLNSSQEKIPNEYLDKMKDLERRICFGFNYPKHRREGATYKAECIQMEILTRTMNAMGGIQSMTDEHAKEVFVTKLVAPFRKLQFYFRPYTGGNQINPKKELLLELTTSVTKEGSGYLNLSEGLNSKISYEVSTEGAYDSYKLHFHHDDEVGKTSKVNVYKRHTIIKQCLSTNMGLDINGFTIKTSTVGEMDYGGGRNFLKMCKMSNFYERDGNGQTASGLYNLFIPAYEGMIVDEFGNSMIEKSKKFIDNKLNQLLEKGDVEGWDEYRRMYPTRFSDCFVTGTSSVGFDMYILEKRISELLLNDSITVRGDFIRASADRNSRVSFQPNPNGRFLVSRILPDSESNLYYMNQNGVYTPSYERFSAGGDAFKFNQTEGNRMSDGSIAILENRNYAIDPMDKPIDQWSTDLFVCTYLYRASTYEEYVDDCLKSCQYYGCYMLPETNVNHIVDYFTKWGYSGFLKVLKNADGSWRTTAGMYSGADSKQKIFSAWRDRIKRRGLYERHIEILREVKDIPSIDKMTDFDLFTAGGYAEINSLNLYEQQMNSGVYGALDESDNQDEYVKSFRMKR